MGKNRTLRYLDPACGSLGAQPAAKSPVLPGQSGVSFCKHKFAWAVWQMRSYLFPNGNAIKFPNNAITAYPTT